MSDSIFANVYRKVTVNKDSFFEPAHDERRMMQDQYAAEAAAAVEAYNQKLMDDAAEQWKIQEQRNGASYLPMLESLRTGAINRLSKELPDFLVGECFSEIYVNALPLDKKYVLENYSAFKRLGHLYTRKLGGFDYLKKKAAVTESTFLKKMVDYIEEAKTKTLLDKTEKMKNAFDEKQVAEMINPKISDTDRDKLLTKVDRLGADELAELVQQKVLDVVNDERRKNKIQQEFKDVLKGDLDDTRIADDTAASSSEELNDKTEPTDDEGRELENRGKKLASQFVDADSEANKKASKKKSSNGPAAATDGIMDSFAPFGATSVAEAYSRWNPANGTFDYNPNQERRTFFKSIMENVLTGLIIGKVGTPKRRDPGELINNPLNLVAIEQLLAKDRPRSEYNTYNMHREPLVEASDVTVGSKQSSDIDKEKVLSEALIQYTLLETAHTMRLIDVTPLDVSKQAAFLTSEYNV